MSSKTYIQTCKKCGWSKGRVVDFYGDVVRLIPCRCELVSGILRVIFWLGLFFTAMHFIAKVGGWYAD